MGMANTNKIYDRMTTAGGRATTTYAAGVAWAFTNNGTTDWHLPSLTELKQMCKWQRGIAWTSDATNCADLPALNSGVGASAMGFTRDYYYSSNEKSGRIDQAWSFFMGVSADNAANKGSGFVFRIVRAFG